MKRKIIITILATLPVITMTLVGTHRTEAQRRTELRCGWFSNPTPANAWLFDKDADWTISVQGGYEAKGDWPNIADGRWVKTNVHYGYGCACIRATFDRRTKRVIEIKSGYDRPLSACRQDRALRRREPTNK
jgi:hypothetical protein